MILTVLLPLLLLGSVSADRLRFHLENLIDRNISACDDFYHHACSQYVDPEEFFQKRVSEIFNTTTEMFNGVSDMHSPIAVLQIIDLTQFSLLSSNFNKPSSLKP